MQEIKNLRDDIDKIDDKILSLLEKRIFLAKRINLLKKNGLSYDFKREDEILTRLCKKSEIFTKLDLEFIFKEIFSLSRNLLKEEIILCEDDLIDLNLFGKKSLYKSATLEEIFISLKDHRADLGLINKKSFDILIFKKFINVKIIQEIVYKNKTILVLSSNDLKNKSVVKEI